MEFPAKSQQGIRFETWNVTCWDSWMGFFHFDMCFTNLWFSSREKSDSKTWRLHRTKKSWSSHPWSFGGLFKLSVDFPSLRRCWASRARSCSLWTSPCLSLLQDQSSSMRELASLPSPSLLESFWESQSLQRRWCPWSLAAASRSSWLCLAMGIPGATMEIQPTTQPSFCNWRSGLWSLLATASLRSFSPFSSLGVAHQRLDWFTLRNRWTTLNHRHTSTNRLKPRTLCPSSFGNLATQPESSADLQKHWLVSKLYYIWLNIQSSLSAYFSCPPSINCIFFYYFEWAIQIHNWYVEEKKIPPLWHGGRENF